MLPRISAKNVQNLCNEYAACDDIKEMTPIAKAANTQPLLLNNTNSSRISMIIAIIESFSPMLFFLFILKQGIDKWRQGRTCSQE